MQAKPSILVLNIRPETPKRAEEYQRFVALLGQALPDKIVTQGFYEDLCFSMGPDKLSITVGIDGPDLASFQAVYPRTAAKYTCELMSVIMYLEKYGVACVDYRALRHSGAYGKLAQYVRLQMNQLPIPQTFFGTHENIIAKAKQGSLGFEFPMVLKAIFASRGRDNYLVKDLGELETALTKQPETLFLVQKFINSRQEYRIVVVRDRAYHASYKHRRFDEHHVYTYEEVDLNTLANDLLKDCTRATQSLGIDIAGVDVVVDEAGVHHVIEVNRSPQIRDTDDQAAKLIAIATFINSLRAPRS